MPSILRGVDDFESDDVDFTIIYPNGGTEGSPANISANSRYVESNPFPGYVVQLLLEVNYNGDWGSPGDFFNTASSSIEPVGCNATQLNSDAIIVQTGVNVLNNNAKNGGNSFGGSAGGGQSTLPCRVKVWKVKGATV